MSLLPRSNADFGTKTYWNSFFKKRGKKAFEWYGEYLELSSILGKYIKTKGKITTKNLLYCNIINVPFLDNILMVGCGNSKLSNDLFTVGYRKMTNIDLSEVVIEQMQKAFPNQKWVREDATKTSFPEQSFSVVLDKGTLDALSNNDSEEIKELVTQYFSEVKRVLKQGGRFVCISLLQEHILSQLLEFFPENDFMFRVVRCLEAEM